MVPSLQPMLIALRHPCIVLAVGREQ
jgi:hypothetical protein